MQIPPILLQRSGADRQDVSHPARGTGEGGELCGGDGDPVFSRVMAKAGGFRTAREEGCLRGIARETSGNHGRSYRAVPARDRGDRRRVRNVKRGPAEPGYRTSISRSPAWIRRSTAGISGRSQPNNTGLVALPIRSQTTTGGF